MRAGTAPAGGREAFGDRVLQGSGRIDRVAGAREPIEQPPGLGGAPQILERDLPPVMAEAGTPNTASCAPR
ncbi:MAG: hypothetical protein ACYDCL_05175 [Myxococcales bacterium]